MADTKEPKVDKHQALLDKIEAMETAGMKITASFYAVWQEAMRYFFSDQDVGYRKHADWDYVVLNYIWPSTMQEIAKLAKNNPKIYALPHTDDDIDATEVWQGSINWQWQNRLRMRLKQIAAIFDGKIFGYRVSRVYWDSKDHWDAKQRQWVGDVQYKLWHPQAFWSLADDDIDDGDCGSVRYVELDWAIQHWPGKEKELRSVAIEANSEEFLNFGDVKFRSAIANSELSETDTEEGTIKTVGNSISDIVLAGKINTDSKVKMVRISECFFKDYEEQSQKEEQDTPVETLLQEGTVFQGMDKRLFDTKTEQPYNPAEWPKQTVAEWMQPKYPKGRYVLSVGEGDSRVILNDKEEDQVWPFDRWPWVVKAHYLLPHMWQGVNAVTMYKSCQDTINVSASHLLNNLKQYGDPRMVIEQDAVAINPKTKKPWGIKSAAGAVLRLVKGGLSRYKMEQPAAPSPSAMMLYSMFSQEYKNLTGLQNAAQGIKSTGKTTATEANYLMISSNDRIFLQSVYEDEWVKDVAWLFAVFMQEYYDVGRWVQIVGEEKGLGIQQITDRSKTVKFDLDVEAGSTLPYDDEKKIAKYKMGYDLMANPVANPMLPEMLRALEIPNYRQLLKKSESYQDYLGVVKIYEDIKSGKLQPQQAMQIIMQRLMQLTGGGQGQPGQPPQGPQGGSGPQGQPMPGTQPQQVGGR
jgi:hypothetical protein